MLTLADDGSTSQTRFLAMASESKGDTTWTIPASLAWEGGGELKVMLGGEGKDSDGDQELMQKVQELQAEGKWFKVRAPPEELGRKWDSITLVGYCFLRGFFVQCLLWSGGFRWPLVGTVAAFFEALPPDFLSLFLIFHPFSLFLEGSSRYPASNCFVPFVTFRYL